MLRVGDRGIGSRLLDLRSVGLRGVGGGEVVDKCLILAVEGLGLVGCVHCARDGVLDLGGVSGLADAPGLERRGLVFLVLWLLLCDLALVMEMFDLGLPHFNELRVVGALLLLGNKSLVEGPVLLDVLHELALNIIGLPVPLSRHVCYKNIKSYDALRQDMPKPSRKLQQPEY